MVQEAYTATIYKIQGETIQPEPKTLFESSEVYIIIDKSTKILWIWAGKRSRLFHRYIAATWAGKLKTVKKFHQFKYNLVKENFEPDEFLEAIKEDKVIDKAFRARESYEPRLNRNNSTSKFYLETDYSGRMSVRSPGRNAGNKVTTGRSRVSRASKTKGKSSYNLLRSDYNRILRIFLEVKEIHAQIKYSLNHVEQRINLIEDILKSL